jgi:hypothetical protein
MTLRIVDLVRAEFRHQAVRPLVRSPALTAADRQGVDFELRDTFESACSAAAHSKRSASTERRRSRTSCGRAT